MAKRIQLNETQLKRIIKNSVATVLREEMDRQNIEGRAQMVYDKLMSECPNGFNDWEFEVTEEGIDGPYTFQGYYYTDYEDENGDVWKFDVGCWGYRDMDNTEVDSTDQVEFTSPDGQRGIIRDKWNNRDRLSENTLKTIVAESVEKALMERKIDNLDSLSRDSFEDAFTVAVNGDSEDWYEYTKVKNPNQPIIDKLVPIYQVLSKNSEEPQIVKATNYILKALDILRYPEIERK